MTNINYENKGLIKVGNKFLAVNTANIINGCPDTNFNGEHYNIGNINGSTTCDTFKVYIQNNSKITNLDCGAGDDTVNFYINVSGVTIDLVNEVISVGDQKIGQIKNCEIFHVYGANAVSVILDAGTLAIYGNNATTVYTCPEQSNPTFYDILTISYENCLSGIVVEVRYDNN